MRSPKSIFVIAQLLAMLFMLLPALNRAADSPEQKNMELFSGTLRKCAGSAEKCRISRSLSSTLPGQRFREFTTYGFVDGQFAHLTTGTKDSRPTNPKDNQFYIIVDLRDPRKPREVARWWLPGTQQGDRVPAQLPRRTPQDR